MYFIVDRKYQGYKDNDLLNLMETSVPACLAEDSFEDFKSTTVELQAALPNYRVLYQATASGDKSKIGQRDDARELCLRLFNKVADGVNTVANGDAGIIELAKIPSRPKKAADGELGTTEIKSLKYDVNTGIIKIIMKKAKNARSYRIDVSSDNEKWEEGIAMATKTIWELMAPEGLGTFYFRAVPRNSDGTLGQACIAKFVKVY